MEREEKRGLGEEGGGSRKNLLLKQLGVRYKTVKSFALKVLVQEAFGYLKRASVYLNPLQGLPFNLNTLCTFVCKQKDKS